MSTLTITNLKSTSSLPPTIQNSSGTEIGTFCRAWANINATSTIRAAFNVSSVTDEGVGSWKINFTTAFADKNYAILGMTGGQDGSGFNYGYLGTHNDGTQTGYTRIRTATGTSGGVTEDANLLIAFFR